MLNYIYASLESFRGEFSRERTWLIFCAVVISFMSAVEMIGVTSICRFWIGNEAVYNSLIHFFRSKAYYYQRLLSQWQAFVVNQGHCVEADGYTILVGDHTHVVKDGGKMPGVVSLYESSETQSKPSYFRGQCWGAIGVLTGILSDCFCTPIQLQIQQGRIHLGQNKLDNGSNMAQQLVQMALDFALRSNRRCLLILDAFFPLGCVFQLARSIYSVEFKKPFLAILVRAKKSYVAYFPPSQKPKGQRGPQRKYGDKVNLMECFDHLHLFAKEECEVYGKTEIIQYMSLQLLWKPIGDYVLFIFAITSRGPIILMSSDLTISPLLALRLYCARTRIEIMFDVLKNLLGAFQFHFWSQYMPKHSRRPVPNSHLKQPKPEYLDKIMACWNAYEIFVFCAIIAQGLLQFIAIKFGSDVWSQHFLYLRTRSRELPSEKTVKQVISFSMAKQFFNIAENGVIQKIRRQFQNLDENDEDSCIET